MVLDEPDSEHGSEVADRLVMTTAEQCGSYRIVARILTFCFTQIGLGALVATSTSDRVTHDEVRRCTDPSYTLPP